MTRNRTFELTFKDGKCLVIPNVVKLERMPRGMVALTCAHEKGETRFWYKWDLVKEVKQTETPHEVVSDVLSAVHYR